jgi:uncharacterized protein (TIGR02271 family)
MCVDDPLNIPRQAAASQYDYNSEAEMSSPAGKDTKAVLPLHTEDVSVGRRTVERGAVRVTVQTETHEHLVDEKLNRQHVEIKRVPIARPIDVAPPVRTEGDTTIIPIIEEVLVVKRQLMLKEEIHLHYITTTQRHLERIPLREQTALIERSGKLDSEISHPQFINDNSIMGKPEGEEAMNDEAIVALYDTQAHADAAVRDLESAGIPAGAISQHSQGQMSTEAARPAREPGFWAKLFGAEPEYKYDTTVYDRSLQGGSTVVTVKAPEQYVTKAMEILERHNPIDIDERAASYNVGQAPATQTTGDQTVQLAEETLAVGKRAVNRGTTRIRRYVVETPVEEQVRLREERVSVERRPVSNDRPVSAADFTDKVVEVTETSEEPVVAKTARVKEELVIHKDATERTETVRDTVRREDVEVSKEPDTSITTARTTETPVRSTTDPSNPKV